MFNPFIMFVFVAALVLGVYQLSWSDLYLEISGTTSIYLISLIAFNLILGMSIKNKFNVITGNLVYKKPRLSLLFSLALLCLILFDFYWSGEIPLISKYLGLSYKEARFLPAIHVLIVIFSVLLSQYLFLKYLVGGGRMLLLIFIFFAVIYPMLIVGRGLLFVNIISASLGYFLVKKRSSRSYIFSIIFIVLMLFIFGVLGELRSEGSSKKNKTQPSGNIIYEIASPSSKFDSAGLSEYFLWPYIYIVSPLGNFNNLVDTRYEFNQDFYRYLVVNYSPNFVQKYLLENLSKDKSDLVVDVFNTYTAFGNSYQEFGWYGVFLYVIGVHLFIYFLILFSKPGLLSIVMIELLTVGHMLSWFSNLYVKEIISGPILIIIIFKCVTYLFKINSGDTCAKKEK
jgi:oligosaccharide repeat unit polymerase